jgi:hypothetical protein
LLSIESCGEGRATRKKHKRQSCDDDLLMDEAATCRFYGGIHPATLRRGIAAGRYAKPFKVAPNVNRWLRSENEAARQALILARDGARVRDE